MTTTTITLPLTATINLSATGAITGQITEPVVAPPAPTPPTVTLTASSEVLTAPGSVTLTASPAAATAGATIAAVQFAQNGVNIGAPVTAAPWSMPVTGLAAGNYSFAATATDSNKMTATSSAVTLAVVAATTPPTTLGAPVDPIAYADSSGRAYVLFGPPSNNASNPAVKYVATAAPSGITATAVPVTVPQGGPTILGCRVDFNSLPAGIPQTITVQAVDAQGNVGPASAPSNAITPTPYQDYIVACGGSVVGLSPEWNDAYHFNAQAYRYVQPGTPTASANAIATTAPTNPTTPAAGVIEVVPAVASGGYELQLYITEENPKTTSNGVFNAGPWNFLEFDVYPLVAQQPLSFPSWETTFNADSVVTAGANSTTQLADAAQNWTPNQWLNGGAKGNTGVFNRTRNAQAGYSGNTANTLSVGGFGSAPQPGDRYYIQSGDQTIGATLLDLSKYLTSGTLAAGSWSHIKIPLSAFNLPTRMLYKLHVGLTCKGPNTTYFANLGFTA